MSIHILPSADQNKLWSPLGFIIWQQLTRWVIRHQSSLSQRSQRSRIRIGRGLIAKTSWYNPNNVSTPNINMRLYIISWLLIWTNNLIFIHNSSWNAYWTSGISRAIKITNRIHAKGAWGVVLHFQIVQNHTSWAKKKKTINDANGEWQSQILLYIPTTCPVTGWIYSTSLNPLSQKGTRAMQQRPGKKTDCSSNNPSQKTRLVT